MKRYPLLDRGTRFSRLTIQEYRGTNRYRQQTYSVLCDCGNTAIVAKASLKSGNTKSCGCLTRENTAKSNKLLKRTHGQTCGGRWTPEYTAYSGAKARCTITTDKYYPLYGGRGVRFTFGSFEEFYEELGPKPSPKHSVDRKNNDGHYEPGNVHWATKAEQSSNRRSCVNANKVRENIDTVRRLYLDEKLSQKDIAKRFSVNQITISEIMREFGVPARPFRFCSKAAR